jgi:hypothetical protein
MKTLILFILFASALASPVLQDRQSTPTCPSSGISTFAAKAVRILFQRANITRDVVPAFTPTTVLRMRYGSKEVVLGNLFALPGMCPLIPDAVEYTKHPRPTSKSHG